MNEHVAVNRQPMALHNPNDWRRTALYSKPVSMLFRRHVPWLKQLFQSFCKRKPGSMERLRQLQLKDWVAMLKRLSLISTVSRRVLLLLPQLLLLLLLASAEPIVTLTCLCDSLCQNFNVREAILCFAWSRTLVVDELKNRNKFTGIFFTGICTAVCDMWCDA